MLCNAYDDMSSFSARSKHQRCYNGAKQTLHSIEHFCRLQCLDHVNTAIWESSDHPNRPTSLEPKRADLGVSRRANPASQMGVGSADWGSRLSRLCCSCTQNSKVFLHRPFFDVKITPTDVKARCL